MQLTFDAIVLSAAKYGENSGIACILTENNGVYKGLVRGITGARQRGIYQPGNFIEATWRARLSEHLGNLSAGLIHAGAMTVMDNPLKLSALSSLCSLLEASLQERETAPEIYKSLVSFIVQLPDSNKKWQKSYVFLELELLSQLGFGLDLTSCAATGVLDELIYVSPKSGRAVSRDAGKPYCSKLLKLPNFLINKNLCFLEDDSYGDGGYITSKEINDGVVLCGYFLEKYFASHNIRPPQARERFATMIRKTLQLECV